VRGGARRLPHDPGPGRDAPRGGPARPLRALLRDPATRREEGASGLDRSREQRPPDPHAAAASHGVGRARARRPRPPRPLPPLAPPRVRRRARSRAPRAPRRGLPMTDIRIESKSLPCATLRIRRITGVEAISLLFSFELLVVSVDPEGFAPEDALGARIALVFEREGEEHRRVHGVVVQVDGPRFEESGLPAYVLRVAPRAQRMELVKAHDVFVDTPVPQIVTSKLDILGLGADTEMRLAGKYPPRELVIQHDETDL